MVLIRLTSDNYDNQLCTVEAYEEIVLQMSTGDHACHKAQAVVMPESAVNWDEVAYLTDWNRELVIGGC